MEPSLQCLDIRPPFLTVKHILKLLACFFAARLIQVIKVVSWMHRQEQIHVSFWQVDQLMTPLAPNGFSLPPDLAPPLEAIHTKLKREEGSRYPVPLNLPPCTGRICLLHNVVFQLPYHFYRIFASIHSGRKTGTGWARKRAIGFRQYIQYLFKCHLSRRGK